MDENSERRKPQAILLFLTLLLALLLRLLLIGHKCFWGDEGATWFMALGEIRHDVPLIYSYVFNWSIRLFGWSEFAGRLPSAIFGFLSVPVIYIIGRSFFNRKFALWGAFVAGVSAYLIPLSQEMRIYSLLGLEIWLALWFFLHILKNDKAHNGWWAGLLITGIVGQYTHCFFIFVLCYFGLVLFLQTGWKGRIRWDRYIVMMFLILIFSLPQLLQTLSVAGVRQHVCAADLFHLKMNIYRVFRSYFSFVFGDYLTNLPGSIGPFLSSHPSHLAAAIAMVIVWFIMVISGLREFIKIGRGEDFQSVVVKVIMGMIAAFTLLFFLVDISTAGHLIFIYVPFLFIATSFFTFRKGVAHKLILASFLLLTAVSLASHYQSPYFPHQRADWRAAGKLLGREMEKGDAVLLMGARNLYYTLKFYFPEITDNVYYRRRHDPVMREDQQHIEWWTEKKPSDKVGSLLQKSPRVWVIRPDFTLDEEAGFEEEYKRRMWDFGYDLKVCLFEVKAVEPVER